MPWSNISSNLRMYITYFLIYGLFHRLKTHIQVNKNFDPLHNQYKHFASRPPTPLTCLYNTCMLHKCQSVCLFVCLSVNFKIIERLTHLKIMIFLFLIVFLFFQFYLFINKEVPHNIQLTKITRCAVTWQ